MPLPLILGIAASVAAASGVGSGIRGGVKMKEANNTMEQAKRIQENAIAKFEMASKSTTDTMDALGRLELSILNGLEKFADLIEKIQGRPEFKNIAPRGISIPKYDPEQLKEVSVGAGLLLGGLSGAAAGTAGGFAAAGAATTAVMALGTASTGTAIASLSGAALTNATLAALGGGAIAAGGGGIALGTAVLGATTLGVGLLVGGVIFNATGSKLSDKADEALKQAKKTESDVYKICSYLFDLQKYAKSYRDTLMRVDNEYQKRLRILEHIIEYEERTQWEDFTYKDKLTVENTVMLVGLLYKMCKVQLVLKDDDGDGQNTINVKAIIDTQMEADAILEAVA